MNLKILLPSHIFADKSDATRLVVETLHGSWGILPQRRDCVAALVPGVLTLETRGAGVTYVAVDVGTLIKTGADVRICVRRAVSGTDLAQLREQVQQEYALLSQTEQAVRDVSAKLETGFMRQMVALHHE